MPGIRLTHRKESLPASHLQGHGLPSNLFRIEISLYEPVRDGELARFYPFWPKQQLKLGPPPALTMKFQSQAYHKVVVDVSHEMTLKILFQMSRKLSGPERQFPGFLVEVRSLLSFDLDPLVPRMAAFIPLIPFITNKVRRASFSWGLPFLFFFFSFLLSNSPSK